MTEVTRHFTATTFVVYMDRTVLHFHKSLRMWLPPGGHIDRDELPDVCAVREIKEETGLDADIVNPDRGKRAGIDKEGVREMPCPRYILLEDINPHHQHIDLIYFAKTSSDIISPGSGESTEIRWFDLSDIDSFDELTDDIRSLAREAILELGDN